MLNDDWEGYEEDLELDDDENNVIPDDVLNDDDAKNHRTAIENYLLDWYYTNRVFSKLKKRCL